MTKNYTLAQLHKMSGINRSTLDDRLKRMKAKFFTTIKGITKRIRVYRLADEQLQLVLAPINKIYSTKKKKELNKEVHEKKHITQLQLQAKCPKRLQSAQKHWLITFGVVPVPEIATLPSYVHIGANNDVS